MVGPYSLKMYNINTIEYISYIPTPFLHLFVIHNLQQCQCHNININAGDK